MIRSTALAATLTLAAASATACGDGTDASPASDDAVAAVKAAGHGWFRDIAAGDGRRACARLTPNARRQFAAELGFESARDCERAVAMAALMLSGEEKEALPRLRIREVAVRGDRAEVDDRDVDLPEQLTDRRSVNDRPTVFRRIDGRWLMEDVG